MENFNNKNPITPLAITNYRDIRKTFGIKEKNRRGHIYVIGKTGTGKSTLIQNMLISDITVGNGVALIDPHGDLAEEVLNFIPEKRIEDVIYFNPADLANPIAFNPLTKTHPDFHHLVASGLISVFKKIWFDSWGPRLEHILRYSILTLLEYPGSTLLDLPRLLTIKDFRTMVLKTITDHQVTSFWEYEFEKYSAWLKSESTSPILNKIGQFLASPVIRNIVGQKQNTFSFRKVMDEGKIFITNLSKGKIGEDACSLLGSMIVTRIQLAALSRADVQENRRKTFYVFVDELQTFLTLSFSDVLAESRKYGVSLVLAHQYIDQLDEKIRHAILGNIGTLISFRIGSRDAKYLKDEFYPEFNEIDLVNMPNYHIIIKMLIDGITSKAFSANTIPPTKSRVSYREKIIEVAREKYARPRSEVEKEIRSKCFQVKINKPKENHNLRLPL